MKSATKWLVGGAVALGVWWFFIRKKWTAVPPVATAAGTMYPVTQGRTYLALFPSQVVALAWGATYGHGTVSTASVSSPSSPDTTYPYAAVWQETQGTTMPIFSPITGPVDAPSALYTLA